MPEDNKFGEGPVDHKPMNNPHTVHSGSDERVANNVMRHEYRVLSGAEKEAMQAVKDACLVLLRRIEALVISRETSLARTKTEEAVMWAVKHITK